MSADSYVVCLRCASNAKEKRERALALVQEKYGKVSAAEYRRLIGEAEAMPEKPKTHDLAEYYEFTIDAEANSLFVNYHATCRVCGFTIEYEGKKENIL